jgi:hypothetical protein
MHFFNILFIEVDLCFVEPLPPPWKRAFNLIQEIQILENLPSHILLLWNVAHHFVVLGAVSINRIDLFLLNLNLLNNQGVPSHPTDCLLNRKKQRRRVSLFLILANKSRRNVGLNLITTSLDKRKTITTCSLAIHPSSSIKENQFKRMSRHNTMSQWHKANWWYPSSQRNPRGKIYLEGVAVKTSFAFSFFPSTRSKVPE